MLSRNAYSDLYNSVCDPWTGDSDAYREERAFATLKAADICLERLNSVSERVATSAGTCL